MDAISKVMFKYKCPNCGKRYNIYMDICMANKANKKFYNRNTMCEDCTVRKFVKGK